VDDPKIGKEIPKRRKFPNEQYPKKEKTFISIEKPKKKKNRGQLAGRERKGGKNFPKRKKRGRLPVLNEKGGKRPATTPDSKKKPFGGREGRSWRLKGLASLSRLEKKKDPEKGEKKLASIWPGEKKVTSAMWCSSKGKNRSQGGGEKRKKKRIAEKKRKQSGPCLVRG